MPPIKSQIIRFRNGSNVSRKSKIAKKQIKELQFENNQIEELGIDKDKLKKDCQEFMIMGSVTSTGWRPKNCQVNNYTEL